jgi:hypothetical protein
MAVAGWNGHRQEHVLLYVHSLDKAWCLQVGTATGMHIGLLGVPGMHAGGGFPWQQEGS